MMPSLNHLTSALSLIRSERATDRKSGSQTVLALIRDKEIYAVLDRNSDSKGSLTWKTVFQYVKEYIIKESYRLAEKERVSKSQTATILSRRLQEKQECSTVFCETIKIANQRGPRIPCQDLVKHIMVIMSDEFTCRSFGRDYTLILIDDILPVDMYRWSTDPASVQRLLDLYCKLIVHTPEGLDQYLISRAVYALIDTGQVLGCLQPQTLFPFFKKMLQKPRYDDLHKSYEEYIILALVKFSESVVHDCRMQLCELGEGIVPFLLGVLRGRVLDTVKDAVTTFLQLQVSLHHPKGTLLAKRGSYAYDQDVWKRQLGNIYCTVVEHLDDVGKQTGYLTRKVNTAKPELISLLVEVCHIVYELKDFTVDVIDPTWTRQDGMANKKRRVHCSLDTMMDFLENTIASVEVIPRLQLVTALLTKYPETLSSNEIPPLVDQFLQLYTNCKQLELKAWVLKSCLAMAKSFCHWRNIGSHDDDTLSTTSSPWHQVWELATRTVCMNQCHEEGHGLLSFMLRKKLVKPKPEFLNLYRPGCSNKRTLASLETLAAYLDHGGELQAHVTNMEHGLLFTHRVDHSCRRQILGWIFDECEDAQNSQSVHEVQPLPLELTPLAAKITCALVLQHVCVNYESALDENCISPSSFSWISEAEALLHQNAFLPSASQTIPGLTEIQQVVVTKKIVPLIWQEVVEATLKDAGCLLKDAMLDKTSDKVSLVSQSCFMMHILQNMCSLGVLEKHDAAVLNMVARIKRMLEIVGEDLKSTLFEVGDKKVCCRRYYGLFTSLSCMLSSLASATCLLPLGSCSEQMALIEDIVPEDLLQIILRILRNKCFTPDDIPPTTSIQSTRRSARLHDCDDGFSDQNDDDDEDLYWETGIREMSDYHRRRNKGSFSLLSRFALTKDEILVLEACRVIGYLCQWLSKYTLPGSTNSLLRSYVKILEQKDMDMSKAIDLQLFFQIIRDVVCSSSRLEVDVMSVLLLAFRKILQGHYKFQPKIYKNYDVTCQCLEMMTQMIPFLFQSDPKEVKEKLRHPMITMLRALWQDFEQNLGSIPQRAMKILARSCAEFLKHDILKIDWGRLEPQSEEHVGTMYSFFLNCLRSVHLDVRMLIVKHLPCLFATLAPGYSRKAAENIFLMVYENSIQVFSIQEQLSSMEALDVGLNHHLVLLCALKQCAMANSCCEKQVAFTFFQVIIKFQVPVNLIENVISRLSEELGFASCAEFLENHLAYILYHWFKQNYPLQKFPCAIFKCNLLREFCSKYNSILVPLLFDHCDMTTIELIAKEVNLDVRSLLKHHLPHILAHVLPLFSSGCARQAMMQQQAYRSYKKLEEIFSPTVVKDFLSSSLDNIILHVIEMMCEGENDVYIPGSVSFPCPNPPYFWESEVTGMFDYLLNVCCSDQDEKHLVKLLSWKQDSLLKILLGLRAQLSRCHHPHERVRVLLRYSFVAKLLLTHLNSPCVGQLSYFVFKEFLFVALQHLTSFSNEEGITSMSLDFLQQICSKTLLEFSGEIGDVLPQIVSCLLMIVVGSFPKLQKKAVSLLEFLLVSNIHVTKFAVEKLIPLPDLPILRKIQAMQKTVRGTLGHLSLQKEMEHFIWTVSKDKNGVSTSESLKHLLDIMKHRKCDLHSVIDSFQERAESSTIHQLITILIELCHSSNVLVCQLAACCLGEIGPIELSALALPRTKFLSHDVQKLHTGKPIFIAYSVVLNLLKDCLLDKSIHIVETVSSVLKSLQGLPTLREFRLKCKENRKLFLYLHPFWQSDNPSLVDTPTSCMGPEPLVSSLDVEALWIPTNGITHEEWLTNLTCSLISSGLVKDPVLQRLKPVCQLKAEFSDQVLPHLIHNALSSCPDVLVITQMINNFFCKFCEPCVQHVSISQQEPGFPKVSVQTMLNVLHYLWLQSQKRTDTSDAWDRVVWLKNLNYLKVAEAALTCSAPFAALLYIDLWNDIEFRTGVINASTDESVSIQEQLCCADYENTLPKSILNSLENDQFQEVHQLLLRAYRMIGEPDSIHGCLAISTGSKSAQMHVLELQREWNKLLFAYDIRACSGNLTEFHPALIQSLRKCGLHHVLRVFLQGMNSSNQLRVSPELLEAQCEIAWRLGMWNFASFGTSEEHVAGFNQNMCVCLNAASEPNEVVFKTTLRNTRKTVAEQLTKSSLESVNEIYQALARFHLLNLVEDYFGYKNSVVSAHDLLEKWAVQRKMLPAKFDLWEQISVLQNEILGHECHSPNASLAAGFKDCSRHIIAKALENKEVEVAEKTLQKLFAVTSASSNQILPLELEQAKVYWEKNESLIAKQCLHSLITKLDKANHSSEQLTLLHAQALILFGQWQAEMHSESYKTIMEKYFEKAVHLMCPLSSLNKSLLWDARLQIAQYAESQYKNLKEFINADSYSAKKNFVTAEVNALKERMNTLSTEEKRTLTLLQRQRTVDDQELEKITLHCKALCEKAVENYLLCLKGTQEHDIFVFRLIALWFQDTNNHLITDKLQEYFPQLATYKFLPLIHQLAARMDASKGTEHFQVFLGKVLLGIAKDHPFHVLPVILAMCNADKDQQVHSVTPSTNGMQSKQKAAEALISSLKSLDSQPRLHKILNQMETVCNEYITLAYHHIPKTGNMKYTLPAESSILKVRNFTEVPVMSEEILVDKSCQYQDIVYIREFQPTIEFAGGINAPKIIYCVGSNGKHHKQLVKGLDDIRQDAVMQQVFLLVNRLLKKNPTTNKCKLTIRTYKVVPMSRRSGLIQWCDGTQPFGRYLIGSSATQGAHKHYHPNDWTAKKCREALAKSVQEGRSNDERYQLFLRVCTKFHPVFRYFFLEHFPEPVLWLERHLMYVRSVAANSIVGYILGLGDRHVQNILIDNNTAEMIHIDLGVAFDQGHLLPTPETVPFRLTRDVVDGMGICGIEGTFRRCCEKTMEVMRHSQDALLTILEVLLYDPLYAWTLSPQQAMFMQEPAHQKKQTSKDAISKPQHQEWGNSDAVYKRAPRILARLRQKLQGIEGGVPLSISGQVNHLIQEAQDPMNLSLLFHGWQPYI